MIDGKPTTIYHDRRIIVDRNADLQLLTDSKGAFDIAHISGHYKRTKRMDVKYRYIQEHVRKQILTASQVPSSLTKAKFLTKGEGSITFKQSMINIGFPP